LPASQPRFSILRKSKRSPSFDYDHRMMKSALLALLFCAAAASAAPSDCIIYRDSYGVPHIFGRSDADVVFGYGYAQAEDGFRQLEDNYIHALGRAAEING